MDYITSLFIAYRYDSTTGTFTVPSSGDGFYYFSAFLTADGDEYVYFDVELNGGGGLSVVLLATFWHHPPVVRKQQHAVVLLMLLKVP